MSILFDKYLTVLLDYLRDNGEKKTLKWNLIFTHINSEIQKFNIILYFGVKIR